MPTPSRRRWFRFSLRGLLIFVMLLSLAGGWTMHHVNWIRKRAAAGEWVYLRREWNMTGRASAERLPLGLRLLGERPFYAEVWTRPDGIRKKNPYSLAELKQLFPESLVEVRPAPTAPQR